MKLAFCIYHYFPFGGLQRDFMQIAQACFENNHEIHIWTTNWDGPVPEGFELHLIHPRGFSNHRQMQSFANQVAKQTQQHNIDATIGFNKIPGLDIYYAADTCVKARNQQRSFWHSILPRYRLYHQFEKAVFADSQSNIIYISPNEKQHYQQIYQTPEKKLHWLSPGLSLDRQYPDNAELIRQQIRGQLNVADDTHMLIMVGSHFKTKGVDRAIKAIAALPKTQQAQVKLFVVGKGDVKPFIKLAKEKRVIDQIQFLGARCDVPELLLAADILLQPSIVENTGTAIIEAMNAGCPVLASAACGYATFIMQANAGMVINEPFQQSIMNQKLAAMLDAKPEQRQDWGHHGREFADSLDLFSYASRAAKLIETILARQE